MNATLLRMLPLRRLVPVVLGLCLATIATRAYQAGPVKPAAAAEQTVLTFENAKVDPHAAEDAGLWTVAKPAKKAVKRTAFEDARLDPQAAENAKLWDIDVTAGCGHTKKI
jgi:hypothetical protein